MTDDVGFSAPSTFGGVIPTPALDRIAAEGLRYTRMHTTALCSPTRAALLTGRNHHSVATGVVVDQATGYPGYNSIIPRDAVAVGEVLRQNGYDTSWFGKDHNTPQWEGSQAGPFHNWPTGSVKGFDYYYGFIGDDASQWQPNNLFQNHADPALSRQARLEPDHRHGRRGDRADQDAQRRPARPALHDLLRARRHPRTASSDA
jgi:arylsulfatase